MAYTAGDILVQVRGSLAPAESWVNSWSFSPDGGSPNAQACVDALHLFYATLAGTWLPAEFTAVGATIKQLSTGITSEADWTTVTGVNAQDILPTQLAIRVSLNTAQGANGGPFIPGWSKQASAEDGVIDAGVVADLETALETLNTDVLAADYHIGLHRPTILEVDVAARARIGQRFDVIRRRANDQAEAYVSVPLG